MSKGDSKKLDSVELTNFRLNYYLSQTGSFVSRKRKQMQIYVDPSSNGNVKPENLQGPVWYKEGHKNKLRHYNWSEFPIILF